MFDVAAYQTKLRVSQSIADCEKVPMPPLREDQNYVFISYSHRDYKAVYSDLAVLYAAGVRFCYDREALQAGVPWDEDVLNYIRNPRCSGVIFFLSRDLFASRSIQTEIEIATDLHGTGGGAKSYFCVNLTQQKPSRILMSLGALSDEELERYGLDTERIALLARTFSDRATYLSFDSPNHARELIDVIRDQFNVMPDACFEFPEGVYEGALHAGKRSGQGRFTFLSGDIYEGEWQDDKRCGEGTMTFANGNRYTGSWSDNKCHGIGTMYYADGDVYEGEWKDGKRSGKGTQHRANGDVYEGEWKDDKFNGRGILRLTDGRVYDGDWKAGAWDGRGVFTWPSGQRYEGEFRSDTVCGYGVMHYADGRIYEGEWKDNKWNGQGKLTQADGSVWQGEFRNGEAWTGKGRWTFYFNGKPAGNYDGELLEGDPEGCGKCCFPGGSVYEGEWRRGVFCGKGCYRWPNGGFHEGEWRDNLPNGQGIRHWADGTVYEGQWHDGVREGFGKERCADGNTYEGDWKDGKWDGQGVFCGTNGERYEGQWHDDVREGFGKERNADGDTYEGDWKDGKWDGQGVFCGTNGERYEGQWRVGRANGFGKMHFADGTDYEGEWKDGKQNGHGILYVSQEYRYIDPIAKPEYDEPGQVYRVSCEGEFRNGIPSGPCCLTIPDVMKMLGRWEGGLPVGKVRIFYDGNASYEGEQVNLQPHGKGLYITSDYYWILGTFERGKLVEGQFIEPNANLLSKDEALQDKMIKDSLLDDLAKRGGQL